jgi:hypothetical protein
MFQLPTGDSLDQRGIIPRAFELLASRQAQLVSEGWSFEMKVSFLEIYCEQVRDLLASFPSGESTMLHPSSDAARALKYKIVENEAGQHVVEGAELLKVDPTDTAQIAALLAYAGRLRSVAATAMNPSSSRSHAVLTLHTKAVHTKRGVARHGQLNLVTPDINFPFFALLIIAFGCTRWILRDQSALKKAKSLAKPSLRPSVSTPLSRPFLACSWRWAS